MAYEVTPAQKKAFTACRKKIQKIFDKYNEQGLIIHTASNKTCFRRSQIPYLNIYFVAKINSHSKQTVFGFTLSMLLGFTSWWGVASILINKEDKFMKDLYKNFPDKEKWEPVIKNILKEVEKETVFERFIFRKEEGLI